MKCFQTKKVSLDVVKSEGRQVHNMYNKRTGNSTTLEDCIQDTIENYLKHGWEIVEK